MCKKQTSVSHSSTESEIISVDAGLRYGWLTCARHVGYVVADESRMDVEGEEKDEFRSQVFLLRMSLVHFPSWMSLLCLCTTKFVRNRSIAEQESVERVQQHTVEQFIHVPIPQELIVESIQVIPRELFPERIEEQIVDIPCFFDGNRGSGAIIPQERFQQRTVGAIPALVIGLCDALSCDRIHRTSTILDLQTTCLVSPQCSFTAVEAVEMVTSPSHEREWLQPVEQSVHTLHRPDEIVEAAAFKCARKRPPRKATSGRPLCTGSQA